MGSHLRFFPVAISMHSLWRSNLKKWHKAKATTSVSTVTINNHLNQLLEASRACKIKHVCVSLWLQGCSEDKSASKFFEGTSSEWVAMISTIFAGLLIMLTATILNRSALLLLFFENISNFFAIGVSFLIDVLTPISFPSLVCPLILFVL